MSHNLIIVLVTFLFVAFIIPHISKIAVYVGAVDKPDHRKVHQGLMPRMGGLGIFLGFLLGYLLFSEARVEMIAILIGGFIIVITGVIDDINPMQAKYKFFAQIIAALVVVVYGDLSISTINLPFGASIDLGILKYPVTVIWIAGITNAINLIDGLDGLASGISSIYFLTISIIAIVSPLNDVFTATLSLIMLGSTLGFLKHNFHPAKIFMGDTGSLFLGYIISVISVLGFKNATFVSLFIPIIILAVPILDTAFAIIRRFLRGESISKPDRQHLHHQLLDLKFGHRGTVIVIYLVAALYSAVAIAYSLLDNSVGNFLFFISTLLVIWFIEKTSILSENYKPISWLMRKFTKKDLDKNKTS